MARRHGVGLHAPPVFGDGSTKLAKIRRIAGVLAAVKARQIGAEKPAAYRCAGHKVRGPRTVVGAVELFSCGLRPNPEKIITSVGGAVEMGQHGRVFGYAMEQSPEIAQRPGAQQQVLRPHGLRADHLLQRGGKVLVPEQRHAPGQRRRRGHHLAHPPGLDFRAFAQTLLAPDLPLLRAHERAAGGCGLQGEVRRGMKRPGHLRLADDLQNSLPGRLACQGPHLGFVRRKTGAQQEMPGLKGRKPGRQGRLGLMETSKTTKAVRALW